MPICGANKRVSGIAEGRVYKRRPASGSCLSIVPPATEAMGALPSRAGSTGSRFVRSTSPTASVAVPLHPD